MLYNSISSDDNMLMVCIFNAWTNVYKNKKGSICAIIQFTSQTNEKRIENQKK